MYHNMNCEFPRDGLIDVISAYIEHLLFIRFRTIVR